MGVNLLIASVNVVTTNSEFCPMCTCDPCECEWSNDEHKNYNDAEGDSDLVQVPEHECDGDSRTCLTSTLPDIGSSIYDCISDFSGYPRERSCGQHNQNLVGKIPIFNIGDLVRWFPVSGIVKHKKIWVVKKILNPSLLDSGWYDYEITDGIETQCVTRFELFTVGEA